ncbi:arginine/lysine/ornithine decarboxylase [Paenibacillus shirakamiensis]|uniref:Arginine/lysine/ornithine decarboxylase n=1 Tax=Paenibacillus shirakamiensis TaxID=1265935 RepID=A0ABS4JLT9_9BACL|nr:aminotransferase class I/II-fold pyridoxal phosphate-dependent enzyme [Paenibacillus shirakamiensis]MBP2002680.1 arginine/lysine/ornithine decarboxylase [Paenibacillus shirakamiensis]
MSKFEQQAPLAEALVNYAKAGQSSFHVPGHKNGHAFKMMRSEAAGYLERVALIDATEIIGLDDLHHPEGVIAQAQERAARFYGADESFFLVGGSTVGNQALILSVCTEPGDVLLVQRNVHKSIIHGCMLAGAHVVFLTPQFDARSGLAIIPSYTTVAEALIRYPEAKGLLVTSPNYYGMGESLKSIIELCHEHDLPVLVDEAHGAHFGLHTDLPVSAMAEGADGVVQSTHKMLTALTMGSMLHIQGDYLNRSLLKQRLAMLQSSSPSYAIMASLDLTRSELEQKGEDAFTEALIQCNRIRDYAKGKRLSIVEPEGIEGYSRQDPFKIVIYDKFEQRSGYELQEMLEKQGCIPEMSDHRHVVLALSLATSSEEIDHLINAMNSIEDELADILPIIKQNNLPNEPLMIGEQNQLSTWNNSNENKISDIVPFNLRTWKEDQLETILLEKVEGYSSGEMVIPYPPGIPLLYIGEVISKETIEVLKRCRLANFKCQGVSDTTLRTLRVISSGKLEKQYVE